MYQKNGLLYWILDDRGNKIGVPIKASALVSRPTMKNLQSKFQANEQFRPIHKERLTKVIDSFFQATDYHTRVNFCDYLNFHGINPVFRETKDGRVYGITLVDNRKGSVINGRDLGKPYSGQALSKRFVAAPQGLGSNFVARNRSVILCFIGKKLQKQWDDIVAFELIDKITIFLIEARQEFVKLFF